MRAQTVLLSDNFTTDTSINSSLWFSDQGSPRINNHRLLLESTPNHGCDVLSYATFEYDQVQIQTPSYAWEEDTSIGFETWAPAHEGVVVTHGNFGCMNDTITTTGVLKE